MKCLWMAESLLGSGEISSVWSLTLRLSSSAGENKHEEIRKNTRLRNGTRECQHWHQQRQGEMKFGLGELVKFTHIDVMHHGLLGGRGGSAGGGSSWACDD